MPTGSKSREAYRVRSEEEKKMLAACEVPLRPLGEGPRRMIRPGGPIDRGWDSEEAVDGH